MIDFDDNSGKFSLNKIVIYDDVIYDVIFWSVINRYITTTDQQNICIEIMQKLVDNALSPIESSDRSVYMVDDIGVANFKFLNGEVFVHFKYNFDLKTIEVIDPNEISQETKIILEEILRKNGICKTNSTAVLRMIFNDDSFNLRDEVTIRNEST